MGYKYRNGSTPNHQMDVSDMDGVDNVADVVSRQKEASMESSMDNPQKDISNNSSMDLSGISEGINKISSFISKGGAKLGSALSSDTPKYGPFGPGLKGLPSIKKGP